jgi:hypothetical protein
MAKETKTSKSSIVAGCGFVLFFLLPGNWFGVAAGFLIAWVVVKAIESNDTLSPTSPGEPVAFFVTERHDMFVVESHPFSSPAFEAHLSAGHVVHETNEAAWSEAFAFELLSLSEPERLNVSVQLAEALDCAQPLVTVFVPRRAPRVISLDEASGLFVRLAGSVAVPVSA